MIDADKWRVTVDRDRIATMHLVAGLEHHKGSSSSFGTPRQSLSALFILRRDAVGSGYEMMEETERSQAADGPKPAYLNMPFHSSTIGLILGSSAD